MNKKNLFYLIFCLFIVSCGQDYNSNSGDKGRYTPIEGVETPLLASYRVMQEKCFQCHQWSTYKTSEQWVTAGLVSRGSTSGSSIYTRLKNSGSDMPPDPIAQLTSEELTSLQTWINAL